MTLLCLLMFSGLFSLSFSDNSVIIISRTNKFYLLFFSLLFLIKNIFIALTVIKHRMCVPRARATLDYDAKCGQSRFRVRTLIRLKIKKKKKIQPKISLKISSIKLSNRIIEMLCTIFRNRLVIRFNSLSHWRTVTTQSGFFLIWLIKYTFVIWSF